MSGSPIIQKTSDLPWIPASAKGGPELLFGGKDVIFRKNLSDRRSDGEGIAMIVRFVPPPGKKLQVLAEALSDEHVFVLEGGYIDRNGRQIRFPGDYILNPRGLKHGPIISIETVALVVYTGEPDRLIELKILD